MIITDDRWNDLLDTRATRPDAIAAALAARTPRSLLAADGATFIIAIDHPARGMVGVADQPFVMANRRDVIERTMVALADPGVDGVMATPDILDDLALLGALDGKVACGSLNRGGLVGSAWELDDQLTAHTVESIVDQGLDGAKMLLRIDLADKRTRYTIESCAEWITELAAAEKIAMLEPLPYTRECRRAGRARHRRRCTREVRRYRQRTRSVVGIHVAEAPGDRPDRTGDGGNVAARSHPRRGTRPRPRVGVRRVAAGDGGRQRSRSRRRSLTPLSGRW